MHVMKDILNTYEAASGQAIILPKSEIFYSRNVPDTLKNNITNILGVQAILGTGKYLGMPSMIGRDRTATFAYIKDRVWQRINSWSSKNKFLFTSYSVLCYESFSASHYAYHHHRKDDEFVLVGAWSNYT